MGSMPAHLTVLSAGAARPKALLGSNGDDAVGKVAAGGPHHAADRAGPAGLLDSRGFAPAGQEEINARVASKINDSVRRDDAGSKPHSRRRVAPAYGDPGRQHGCKD